MNFEQARAGFRISLVWNITVPAGVLVFLNEFAPGWLAATLGGGTPNGICWWSWQRGRSRRR